MVESGRQCQKCYESKPLSEFTKDPRIESGHLWKCKECETSDLRKWVEHTREKRRW